MTRFVIRLWWFALDWIVEPAFIGIGSAIAILFWAWLLDWPKDGGLMFACLALGPASVFTLLLLRLKWQIYRAKRP